MIIEEDGKLAIFNNFQTIKRKEKIIKHPDETTFGDNSDDVINFNEGNVLLSESTSYKDTKTYIQRLAHKMSIKWSSLFFNPVKFFKSVQNRKRVLTKVDNVTQCILSKLIIDAESAHQTALVEKLQDHESKTRREVEILERGISLFLESSDVVQLTKAYDKCNIIRLDWIQNFTRLIPPEVRIAIGAVEKFRIFDNYVILHFDPKKKSVEKTKAEKADPIVFGVIKESTRLYYIGDWVDEYCDLTFDKFVSELDLNPEDRELKINDILQS